MAFDFESPQIFYHPLFYTLIWWMTCACWGTRYFFVRRGRKYAANRKQVSTNRRYKWLGHIVFAKQIVLCPLMFWSSSVWLLEFHRSEQIRLVGILLCGLGVFLSVLQLKYLGNNYSPCFDSHLPKEIIKTGPYKFIRHPSWLAKFFFCLGTLAVSGSWWFFPDLIWLIIEMRRTIKIEEESLSEAFPEYRAYTQKTWRLIPFIY